MSECPEITTGMEYTEEDWRRLEAASLELGNCDFRTYLNRMATGLARQLKDIELCEGGGVIKKQRIFTIKADYSCLIQMAAIQRGTNPGRLLNRLIVHPMFKHYHDKNGF